jgi:hypothetical protein
MKSPESTVSKSSIVKKKFQEKKIRASRSANLSMKSPEHKRSPSPKKEEEDE